MAANPSVRLAIGSRVPRRDRPNGTDSHSHLYPIKTAVNC